MKYSRKTTSAEATGRFARTLVPCLRAGDAIVLSGDLGAGKTRFVQGVAVAMGIREPILSPTFKLLSVYNEDGRVDEDGRVGGGGGAGGEDGAGGGSGFGSLPLYHLDLYRLEHEEELEDIGYYDVVEGRGVSFIEWGEKFPHALPDDHLRIEISINAEGTRLFRIRATGKRSEFLLTQWANDSESCLRKNG